jgi:hypothetical protein
MPAAEFDTVLSKSSAGAPVGPLRNNASRNSWVDPPPALHVPSMTPLRSSPSSAIVTPASCSASFIMATV